MSPAITRSDIPLEYNEIRPRPHIADTLCLSYSSFSALTITPIQKRAPAPFGPSVDYNISPRAALSSPGTTMDELRGRRHDRRSGRRGPRKRNGRIDGGDERWGDGHEAECQKNVVTFISAILSPNCTHDLV